MGRRKAENAIDWAAIEKHYRLGQRSVKQLADEYGTHPTTITRRAKDKGWVQDKSQDVETVAKSLLIQAASGNADPNATPSALEVKAAGQAVADVVLEHRQGLKRLRILKSKLIDHIETVIDNYGDVAEVIDMVRKPNENGVDRANDALRRIMERPQLVDDVKKLAEIDERIRKGEREAFGLDDKDKAAAPFEDLLARLGAAAEGG